MPIRSTTPTPYDAKSAILTMSKKLVTPGRTYRTSYRRPAVGRNNGEMTRSKSEFEFVSKVWTDPAVRARVEEAHELRRFANQSAAVASLGVVATGAGP